MSEANFDVNDREDILSIKAYYLDATKIQTQSGYCLFFSETDYSHWNSAGLLHREDGPAVEHDGEQFWFLNGVLHREDGPAIIWADGAEEWLCHGKWHRENGPAIITSSGTEEFWKNGEQIDNFDVPRWN